MTEFRRHVYAAILFLAVLLGAACLFEAGFRIAGFEPWHTNPTNQNSPVLHIEDASRGWKNKPGIYAKPDLPGTADTRVTILPDGSRSTGVSQGQGPWILFLGGSYTLGWGLSDEETLAWKLQSRNPELKITNFGTAGYGTYQCLLLLEELLETSNTPPALVVYGMIEHHEERNVASPPWLERLARHASRGYIQLPYVSLNADKVPQRHAPVRYEPWPLSRHFTTSYILKKMSMKLAARSRTSQKTPATEQLLLQMKKLCMERGSRFHVVLFEFYGHKKEHYLDFLTDNCIDVTDCTLPVSPDMQIPGDGHPNGKLNTQWADVIQPVLAKYNE